MFWSTLTIVRRPSRERRRLTVPMSTPSAVESRNVVSPRSTTIRDLPPSMASPSAVFSSGAVNRSISPRTATTCVAGSTASWVSANSGGISSLSLTNLKARAGRDASLAEGEAEQQLRPIGAHVGGDALEDVAHALQRRGLHQRLAAVVGQRADAQEQARRLGGAVDGDTAAGGVAGRVGGDGVGQQQGVVEAIDRALGAGGEHPDDAAEHRAEQLGAPDGQRRLVDRRGLGAHAIAPGMEPSSSNTIRTSVSSRSLVPSSSDDASVAMSGRPRPSPGLSGRGRIPRPSSATTTVRAPSLSPADTAIGPSPSG